MPSPADLAPPPPAPLAFPPLTRPTEGTTAGSRPSTPTDGLACPPGKTTLPADAPWSGGGDWQGTGHPDPEPLRKISDADMLALAADPTRADPDRQHALVSIGRRKLPGAIDVYRQSLAPSQPHAIREMSITGLIEHGGPAALPLFQQTLATDPDAQLRGMAIWAIAFYGPSNAHPAILRGLEDPDPEVQGMAVLAVWALRDRLELALPILEATALADERRVWQEALNVLDRLPTSDAGNLLARFAETSKGDKQLEAARHLRTWRRRYPELCR